MKVTELMLGDILEYMGTIVKVHSIGAKICVKECFGKNTYIVDFDNLLKGLELTPEILEKNFSSTNDWYFIGTDKFCFRIDKYKDKWDLYFGRDGKGTNLRIKINYVHELQHALRLCGINKEIEI